MNIIEIARTDHYAVLSHGNGWAYQLVRTGEESCYIWLQDDGALSFREEWASLENAYPDTDTGMILADLWHQYWTED